MAQVSLDRFLLPKKRIVDPNDLTFTCDWCGLTKRKMTMWQHISGTRLCLCFLGCQHFPEPFRKIHPQADFSEWVRIDRFQDYHKVMDYGRGEPY